MGNRGMTNAEIFALNQEINTRLTEMANGDWDMRKARQKDIMQLVTKLCVELVTCKQMAELRDLSVM